MSSEQELFSRIMSALAHNRTPGREASIEITGHHSSIAYSSVDGECVHHGVTLEKHLAKILARVQDEAHVRAS